MDSLKRFKDYVRDLPFFSLSAKTKFYNGIFSLSIDEKGIAFVYIKHNKGTFELQAANQVACNLQELPHALHDLFLKYELEHTACSWLLTQDKYQLLQIEELAVLPEEFQSAVRWQVKKMLSFSIDDAFIDSFPVPPPQITNPKKNIQVVASQASMIQPMADIIMASGLNLTTIDIQELALRNITAMFENDDRSTALIYLQEKTSTITITRQKLFYFSRKLDWALDEFINQSKTPDQANEYLDKLALELHRSFDYFQGQWRFPAPVRILIAPFKTTTIDIAAFLSQRLNSNIQTLDLNSVMQSKVTLDVNLQGRYLPLLGAALRVEVAHATAN